MFERVRCYFLGHQWRDTYLGTTGVTPQEQLVGAVLFVYIPRDVYESVCLRCGKHHTGFPMGETG